MELIAGAKPDMVNKSGDTALHTAARTALHTSYHCEHAWCVDGLCDIGACIDARNDSGETSLQVAVESDHTDRV